MASSASAILEENKTVTWSNTIIDYSRKIQKAEKGKLPARVARRARGPILGSRSWGLTVGYLNPKNPTNPTNSKNSSNSGGSQFPAKRERKAKREKTVTLVFGKKSRKNNHCVSVKGGYPIPLQTCLSGRSNYQYVGSNTDVATVEIETNDCLYVSILTRANAVSRWAGKRGAKKNLDSTGQRSRDMLLDRPLYSTFSHFSEADRSIQSTALSSVREGFDCEGEIE